MSYEVIATDPFKRKLKQLAKQHLLIKNDLVSLIDSLSEKPKQGTHLGSNSYEIRLAISSKSKGKSGGARIITFVRVQNETVYLLDIYDKSDQASISDKELKMLIKLLAE